PWRRSLGCPFLAGGDTCVLPVVVARRRKSERLEVIERRLASLGQPQQTTAGELRLERLERAQIAVAGIDFRRRVEAHLDSFALASALRRSQDRRLRRNCGAGLLSARL